MSDEENKLANDGNIKYYGQPEDMFKLYQAIGKAQSEFLPLPKKQAGQYGNQKFDYAPYHVIRKCILPALTANGVSVMQPTHSENGQVAVTLIVSGHGAAINSTILFEKNQTGQDRFTKEVKFDVQLFGREHTYWRRYQLQSFFCLEGDKDADDLVEDVPTETKHQASKPAAARAPAESKANVVVAAPTKPVDVAAPGAKGQTVTEKLSSDTRSVNQKLTDAMKALKWSMDDFSKLINDNLDRFPGYLGDVLKMTSDEKNTLYSILVEKGLGVTS